MPIGTDVLGDQKSVPENSEMKFLTMKPGSLVSVIDLNVIGTGYAS